MDFFLFSNFSEVLWIGFTITYHLEVRIRIDESPLFQQFSNNWECLQLRAAVRELADKELAPYAHAIDKDNGWDKLRVRYCFLSFLVEPDTSIKSMPVCLPETHQGCETYYFSP